MVSIKKHTLIFVTLLLFANFCLAQKTPKYPSLLWEITGKGSQKPSYLYGTMHVSNKVAYHLSDNFFDAISNVDVVGLESNPDEWLGDMKKYGMFNDVNNRVDFNMVSTNFYKNAFTIKFPTNQVIASLLASEPEIVNGLLYRYSGRRENFEESTYIDLFIYQAASKWNKKIISLEDFKTSEILAKKSVLPNPDEENNYANSNKKYTDYYALLSQVDDAYRRGDLDALDSLTRLMSTNSNHQKYLIDERNVIMAHTMDSVIKKKPLFSGIGAAHLPGTNGVIELLRKLGYTVKPVIASSTKKGKKIQEKLETTFKPLPVTTQYSGDSLCSFEMPGKIINVLNDETLNYDLHTDMTNGTYYTISKIRTYAPMFGVSVDMMMKKLDSLFYENIPGKIINKKEIDSSTGIRGFDISNLTLRGDCQRYQVYVTDFEIIVVKVGGHGSYVKDSEGARFFNSLKFFPKNNTSAYINYRPPTGGFEAKIPDNYYYYKNNVGKNTDRAENLFAYDKTADISFGVMHSYYNDFDYLDEDTFELNILCDKFLKNLNYKTEISKTFGKQQNFPCLSFSAKKQNVTLNGKIIIKGVHYYLAYSLCNEDKKKQSDAFLNSMTLTDFNYVNESKTITDKDYFFTVKDETTPGLNNEIEDALAGDYKRISATRNKNKFNEAFKYEYKSKSYYSPSSAEHINIEYQKYNDYDFREKDKLWSNIVKSFKLTSSLIISKQKLVQDSAVKKYEISVKDTATSRAVKYLYILKNGIIYTLSAPYDTSIGTSGWTDTFLKTFNPIDSVIGKNIFDSNFAQLLKDLTSSDCSKKYAATQSLSAISYDKSYVNDFTAFLNDSASFSKIDEASVAVLLVNGGTLESEKIIPAYKKFYKRSSENTYQQVCVINGLGYLKTKNSYNAILELLKQELPLVGDERTIDNVFTPFYDSLELSKNLFPGLLDFTRFEEYKVPVYKLLAHLIAKEKLNTTSYLVQKNNLLMEANYELKRFNAASFNTNSNSGIKKNEEDLIKAEADRVAEATVSNYNDEENTETANTRSMLENFALILAPFYETDEAVKNYFGKLIKIKNENTLLKISLILLKNKIPVNDTIWKHYSKNTASRAQLYEELTKLKAIDKFDKKYISQEEFCKATISNLITYSENSNDYDADRTIQKKQPDTLVFLSKIEAHNKYDKGYIYFFKRLDYKNPKIVLAYVFVRDSKNEISTGMEVLETKYILEENQTTDEVIKETVSEFYCRHHKRCVSTANYYNGYD